MYCFVAVAGTLGKATALIQKRRGFRKSSRTAKSRIFLEFGVVETTMEQRRPIGGLMKGRELPYPWTNPEKW
jgi:hypothetical protein